MQYFVYSTIVTSLSKKAILSVPILNYTAVCGLKLWNVVCKTKTTKTVKIHYGYMLKLNI